MDTGVKIMSYDNRRYALLEARPGFYPHLWFHYLRGYKHAFQALVEDVLRKNIPVDYMAHPILFVARHAIEIGLKANVFELEQYTKCRFSKIENCHKITKWLLEFNRQVHEFYDICETKQISIDQTDKDSYDKYYQYLFELIKGNDKFDGLGEIDDGSIKFRYPYEWISRDKSKPPTKRVFEVADIVSIAEVEKLFNEAIVLLEYTPEVLHPYMKQFNNNESGCLEE
ncbi:MAG: hypothetical protein RBQ87_00480 [Candidatus Cloacimonadaceae bacterium]|jgi:hypothetical protein|nr:hypothetical protein [Candidatus Cloacimonadaceae bacterium]